ncbi:phage holin, lambda family [Pseudomonas sp. CFBP 8772]|uniref:phage holin, lambda family n=1 Tax=Pseudomonas sp. CFBP 8772 TaxID=2775284 RepID=UPI00177F724B|nr:phage holin, lambda family [Pseudomonas sp. CFBP 8772]MBD8597076.1 phage holin, lambda family [Pseudomonas sp. CFBP 8772]
MPDKPDSWAWFAAWLQQNWPAFYAGGLAAVIAALRIMYGGGTWRRVLLEAPLCGLLALSASHGLSLLGIPTTTGPFFGGVIGLLGVETTRAIAKSLLNRKVEQV